MNIIDIISKKRDNNELSDAEIKFWIDGVVDGSIKDYQSSALLMAIVLNQMSPPEVASLTKHMMHSGAVIDLSAIDGIKVDKHSTGGVGDKTSLVLTPLVAACGGKVAKMSGRGLGHTGGTLDKLESIQGFNIYLSQEELIDQVNAIGCAIIGQSEQLVKADKILYSLRDVTGTVDSIALIASSIMSKKLASGTDAILLDVKIGEGAFMRTVDKGRELAQTMISIGKHLGRDVRAVLSDMNQPLGNAIGNSLEVKEAIATLQNKGPREFEKLCVDSAAIMLTQAKIASDFQSGQKMAHEALRSGKAFDKFVEWIVAQGGSQQQVLNTELLPHAKNTMTLESKEAGWVKEIFASDLGRLSMHLGGGRQNVEDTINYGVGLVLHAKIGQKIQIGDPLITIHYDEDELSQARVDEAYHCFKFSTSEVKALDLIKEIIN